MANFEAFRETISSSINLLFLKSGPLKNTKLNIKECWDAHLEVIFDEVEDYALSKKFKKFVDLFVNEVIQNLKFKKDVVELICHTEVQNVLAKDCKELKCYFYTARFFFLHFYFFDVRCLLWSMLIKGLC